MLPLVRLGAVYSCAQGFMNAAAAGVNSRSRNRIKQMRPVASPAGTARQAMRLRTKLVYILVSDPP